VRVPGFRELRAEDDKALLDRHLNRVTDTCIPEEAAMRKIEHHMVDLWANAQGAGQRFFPHEYFYQLLRSKRLVSEYQIDPRGSWLVAASERDLPLFVPGWKTRPWATCSRRCTRGDCDPASCRCRVHDAPDRPAQRRQAARLILPDRRRHPATSPSASYRCCIGTCAAPRAPEGTSPDPRPHVVQVVQRRTAQREDHVGQADVDTPRFMIESDATSPSADRRVLLDL
jgi:hypothetical protein